MCSPSCKIGAAATEVAPMFVNATRAVSGCDMRALEESSADVQNGYGLSSVILSLRVAPPGMVAPWHTLAAARPFRRTWQVPHRPFLQSNLILIPALLQTAPIGSPCLAATTLLPFCGNVTSTAPFG
eukprot:CAMPEP_0119374064 /NCGR_PEP_ID=MMETSP1334-20130426/28750_1 /TAXON_ID=127549 /ORGANISM="Calcidiscus leptoporus, Strain RCC1130" /LENGTH=126 /DNA_ID=CAMNT_0007392015 /DNA_START=299 /DNA_END=679 /DNA_ORIENTATION=+